jgi:hypothetical protein
MIIPGLIRLQNLSSPKESRFNKIPNLRKGRTAVRPYEASKLGIQFILDPKSSGQASPKARRGTGSSDQDESNPLSRT